MNTKHQVIYAEDPTEEPITQPAVSTRTVRGVTKAQAGNTPVSDPKEEKKLEQIVTNSRTILFKCSTVFPFDLFPDELTIEATQVNVRKKVFFWTDQMVTLPVKNISDIVIHTIPFFASIRIVDQYFANNSIELSFMKKDDALEARKIIQGLVTAAKEEIEVTKIRPKKLKQQAQRLGEMQTIE